MILQIYSKTDKGKVRQINEDAFAAGELTNGMCWAIVCDGMGGQKCGEIASATAVKVISDYILSSYRVGMSANSIKTMLNSAVSQANIKIYDMSINSEDMNGMGTTVVATLIVDGVAYIAHAGDSRLYYVRNGSLTQVTRDHSMVQKMVEKGQITANEAKFHPRKNIITRALGVNEDVEIEYDEIDILDNDVLLLCTDGLTNFVDVNTIEDVVNSTPLNQIADKLIELANESGGGDNITAVVIS